MSMAWQDLLGPPSWRSGTKAEPCRIGLRLSLPCPPLKQDHEQDDQEDQAKKADTDVHGCSFLLVAC